MKEKEHYLTSIWSRQGKNIVGDDSSEIIRDQIRVGNTLANNYFGDDTPVLSIRDKKPTDMILVRYY